MMDENARLTARVNELLLANNALVDRERAARRRAEQAEADLAMAQLIILRLNTVEKPKPVIRRSPHLVFAGLPRTST